MQFWHKYVPNTELFRFLDLDQPRNWCESKENVLKNLKIQMIRRIEIKANSLLLQRNENQMEMVQFNRKSG